MPGRLTPSREVELARCAAANAAMALFADGQNDAFPQVYRLLEPRLRGFLRRRTRDDTLARDLLQDAMVRIIKRRGTYITGTSVLAWSISICHHLFIDEARRNARRGVEVELEPEDSGRLCMELQTPEHILEGAQVLRLLNATLAALPPRQRDAFLLVQVESLSYADAADALGITLGSLNMLLRNARQAILAALQPGAHP